ncbi:MAG: HU family DNA-binding protein [Chloroherpetonaceae bacterium]|nr:HU family DNA-binding protein [Chloroherpetonaceae bacterium]
MTKADIVNIVSERTGITKIETEIIIDGFIEAVIASLKSGERIEIRGFGTFNVRKRNKRISKHPKTGETILVGEKYVPTFKISRDFKNIVSEKLKRKKFEE